MAKKTGVVINIEESLSSDPRFKALLRLFKGDEVLAYGSLVNIWVIGFSYWKKSESLIPKKAAKMIQHLDYLLASELVEEHEHGYYIKGSAARWGWYSVMVRHRSTTAKKQRRAPDGKFHRVTSENNDLSIRSKPLTDRKDPHGTASLDLDLDLDLNLDSNLALDLNLQKITSGVQEPPPGPKSSKPKKPEKKTVESGPSWAAYTKAYLDRWGHEPLKNVTTRSQMVNFIKRVGQDDAPEVLKFFLAHNDGFYLKTTHAIGSALSHAESLYTQWKRNKPITSVEVREHEWQQQQELRSTR